MTRFRDFCHATYPIAPKATAAILRKLPAEAFARQSVLSVRGLLTLEQTLTMAANHIAHHLTFIHDKKKALGIE